jgi:hypothetical protein
MHGKEFRCKITIGNCLQFLVYIGMEIVQHFGSSSAEKMIGNTSTISHEFTG